MADPAGFMAVKHTLVEAVFDVKKQSYRNHHTLLGMELHCQIDVYTRII